MPEKQIENYLKAQILKKGGLAIKIYSFAYTGLPDRLVLMPGGKPFWVELKDGNKPLQPRQVAVHKVLRELGFIVIVIRSKEEVKLFVDGL